MSLFRIKGGVGSRISTKFERSDDNIKGSNDNIKGSNDNTQIASGSDAVGVKFYSTQATEGGSKFFCQPFDGDSHKLPPAPPSPKFISPSHTQEEVIKDSEPRLKPWSLKKPSYPTPPNSFEEMNEKPQKSPSNDGKFATIGSVVGTACAMLGGPVAIAIGVVGSIGVVGAIASGVGLLVVLGVGLLAFGAKWSQNRAKTIKLPTKTKEQFTKLPDWSEYTGQVNKEGNPHGIGLISNKYADKNGVETIWGEFKDGKLIDGYHSLVCYENKEDVDGFVQCYKNGKCISNNVLSQFVYSQERSKKTTIEECLNAPPNVENIKSDVDRDIYTLNGTQFRSVEELTDQCAKLKINPSIFYNFNQAFGSSSSGFIDAQLRYQFDARHREAGERVIYSFTYKEGTLSVDVKYMSSVQDLTNKGAIIQGIDYGFSGKYLNDKWSVSPYRKFLPLPEKTENNDGTVTICYHNGDSFTYKKEGSNDEGLYRFCNGDTFQGNLNRGMFIKGIYTLHASGNSYEGESFPNNELDPNGQYKLSYSSVSLKAGETYEGQFKDGKPNGKGKYTYSNGDFIEGEFHSGVPSGTVKLTINGNKIQVEIEAGDIDIRREELNVGYFRKELEDRIKSEPLLQEVKEKLEVELNKKSESLRQVEVDIPRSVYTVNGKKVSSLTEMLE